MPTGSTTMRTITESDGNDYELSAVALTGTIMTQLY